MVEKDTPLDSNPWDRLKEDLQSALESTRRELKEIAIMLEQSQLEVSKLTQRNASITVHLQQAQTQLPKEAVPDLRKAYDAALDAQQRLFLMRGQVEKLQSDQTHLKRYQAMIEQVLQVVDGGGSGNGQGHGSSVMAETVEMIIQAQEAERQRLSRQMHDGPAQALSNFILQTEIALRLFDMDQKKAREELGNMKASATSTFQKVRDFIFELRPMMLDDLGLAPTLRRYVEAFAKQTGIEVRLTVTGMERRLETYQEVMVFRAIQELLNNAGRHSQAALIKVQLDMGDSMVKIMVDDNGRGFDVGTIGERGGMGLKVIRDRVEMLDGYIEIDSIAGKGTRVTFQIPTTTSSTHV